MTNRIANCKYPIDFGAEAALAGLSADGGASEFVICHLPFVILNKVWFADRVNPTVNPTRVIFWNEYIHEKKDPAVAAVYPKGIHSELAAAFAHDSHLICETATLEEKEHGL